MNKKKILSLILVVVFAFQLFAVVACADDGQNSVGDQPSTSVSTGASQDENAEKYKITFVTGNGSAVSAITAKAGEKITKPADPRWARHTFKGWFTDETFLNAYVFTVMPAENITLYAKWEENATSEDIAAYEAALAESSEEGRFYLHYLRFNNDPSEYEQMKLWVWPYQQTGRWFDWDRDEQGNIILDDIAGATCEVDMTVRYTDAGKAQTETMQFLVDAAVGANYKAGDIKNADNYKNPKMGFLIVYTASVGVAGAHWRSDGNADQIIKIEDALWENGSLHVFCVQDNVADHVYHLADQQEIVNPYENDDGTHVSTSNVNSSETLKVNDPTSLLDTLSGVGYQVMVSSFADSDGDGMGDIKGITENLDYLESLNVNVLWLTPIQLSDSYHGYDIIDYKEVDPKFGTLDDYKELLTKCHEKGIKVIMDLVLNHTSTNNVWFQKSVKMVVEDGIDYRNFYQWRNHTAETLSDAWYPYSEYDYSYYAKFSPSMPELNYDNKDTRDAIVDVAKYWMGILGDGKGGVDGFRIDAVKHIYMEDESVNADGDIIISDYDTKTKTDYSSNLTKNINFFTYLINQVKAKYPNAYFVGENFDGHAYNVAPYYAAYDGMLDFYMYYQFGQIAENNSLAANVAGASTDSTNSKPTGRNANALLGGQWDYEAVLAAQQSYRANGIASGSGSGDKTVMGSMFTSNHDIPRLVNNVLGKMGANSVWAAGTISASNKATAEKYALATISTMMTMPGISFIYYGDELGMGSNYADGENENSPHADRSSRQPFKWTKADYDEGGSKYITHFSISGDTTLPVEWDSYNKTVDGVVEQQAANNSFLKTVRFWTNLKANDEVLRYGDYAYYDGYAKAGWGDGAKPLFTFTRTYNGVKYLVVTNFSAYDYSNLKSVMPSTATLVAVSGGGTLDVLPSGGTLVAKIAG